MIKIKLKQHAKYKLHTKTFDYSKQYFYFFPCKFLKRFSKQNFSTTNFITSSCILQKHHIIFPCFFFC